MGLIGWNTFVSRLLFGLALPLLLVSPYTVVLLLPGLRPSSVADKQDEANSELLMESVENYARGEVALLDRPEETRAQLLFLTSKYLVLQSLRLFTAMLAAAAL